MAAIIVTIVNRSDVGPAWATMDAAQRLAERLRQDERESELSISDSGDNADARPVAARLSWSKPDAEGWCYAVDCEGAARARHADEILQLAELPRNRDEKFEDWRARIRCHRFVYGQDFSQRLDEAREEYDRRMIAQQNGPFAIF